MLLKETLKYEGENPVRDLFIDMDEEAFVLLIKFTHPARLEEVIKMIHDADVKLLEIILAAFDHEMYFPKSGLGINNRKLKSRVKSHYSKL